MSIFRRRNKQPAGVTQLPVADALAASAHGLTEHAWLQLTDTERAHHRANVTHGKHFTNGTR